MNRKQNVLFIMADQHHADRLGCCGDPVVRTPHHDRISREGVRFTRAYANSPICGPSRTCFFSGRYVHQHGVYLNSGMDPACSAWMTDYFREHGYTTAGIGKMHMGPLWVASQLDYIRNENIFDAPHDDLFGSMGAHYYSYLAENGLWERCEFFDDQKAGPWPCRTWSLPEEHSPEAWIGRETVRYLRGRSTASPFFLHVSFPRPHDPLYVPRPFDTMYDPGRIPLPANACDDFQSKSPRSRDTWEHLKTKEQVYPYLASSPDELQRIEAHYYGLISLNDKYIGLILDELAAQGILDNTIIVFTADHGDFAGEHGLHFKNLGIYEPVHRIPLLLRCPGRIAAGTVSDLLVESVDLYPTLCDLAGLPVPDRISGASVMPALEDGMPWTKTASVCEWDHLCALRTDDSRLLYSRDGLSNELYDLENDPGEMQNVWEQSSYGELRRLLVRRLLDWHLDTVEKQDCIVPEGSEFDKILNLMPGRPNGLPNREFYQCFNPTRKIEVNPSFVRD